MGIQVTFGQSKIFHIVTVGFHISAWCWIGLFIYSLNRLQLLFLSVRSFPATICWIFDIYLYQNMKLFDFICGKHYQAISISDRKNWEKMPFFVDNSFELNENLISVCLLSENSVSDFNHCVLYRRYLWSKNEWSKRLNNCLTECNLDLLFLHLAFVYLQSWIYLICLSWIQVLKHVSFKPYATPFNVESVLKSQTRNKWFVLLFFGEKFFCSCYAFAVMKRISVPIT